LVDEEASYTESSVGVHEYVLAYLKNPKQFFRERNASKMIKKNIERP
jgi:hypothetical protein